MSPYRLTAKATADLFDIWSYIARDNRQAADKVELAIYDGWAFLAEDPLLGHTRKDLTNLPVRFWTLPRYSNYVIIYDPATKPLTIIRFLHAARNISRQLKSK